MTGVLTLLFGSVAVGLNGHRVLLWLGDRRVHPTVLLTGWVLASLGLVASSVAMVAMVAMPADRHYASGVLLRLAGGCWTALSSGTAPGWRQLFAGLSLVTSAVLLARLVWSVSGQLRRRRRQATHLIELRRLAGEARGEAPLWIEDARPMAMSISGRPGLIIMTQGLRRRLSPQAVQATLEHEKAHLRGRHHALLAIANTLSAAFPFCPLLRAAPSATKDLVELAADAQAALRCGPAAVQEALYRLTGHPVPDGGLGMVGRLTEVRLSRLSTGHVMAARPVRWISCAGVAATALLLPAATGWLALNVVGCVVT